MGNKNNKVQNKEKKEILIQNPNKASTIKCFTYLPLKECCSLSILSTEFYKICHSEDMYQEMIIVYKLKVDDSLPTYKEQFHKVMKIKSKPYYVKQKIEVFPIVKNVVESIVHGKIKETLTFVPVAKGIETHLNLIKSFDGVGDGIFKIYKGIHKDLDEMVYMCTPFHNNYKTFYKNQNQLRHKKFRFDHDGNETKLKLSFYSGLAITSRLTNEIYNSKEVCSNIKMENLKIELLEYVASNEDQLKPISDFLTTPQMGLWKVSNKDQKVLVLAFRGSTCEKSNMTDWFIDGSTTPMTVDFMENKVKVHSGFYGFLRRNSDYILKKTLLHLEHEGNPLLVLTG